MVRRTPKKTILGQEERYDFAFAEIKKLADLHFYNEALRRHEYHIDLSTVYRGNSFNLLETNAPLYPRYLRLKQALQLPGKWREAHVPAPIRSGKFLASSPETFDFLCHNPFYPYYRLDIETLKHHRKIYAKFIDGKNLFEPCGGFGEKIKLMLSQSQVLNSVPKRVIINDTEETNIQHALTGLAELLHDTALPQTSAKKPPELIGVRGDWLDNATYLLQNAVTDGAPLNIQGNILEALRSDQEDTVVYLPGAMANDFFPNNLHRFLYNQFKPGTLFCIGYDSTTNCDLLTNIYKGNPNTGEHPLVQQLALNGLTHACWENLGVLADSFDPRLVGISVDALPIDEFSSSIQISAFAKNRPDQRVYFHPIIKAELYESKVAHDGFEMVTTLLPPSQPLSGSSTRYAMHLFTHKGFADKHRATLEA